MKTKLKTTDLACQYIIRLSSFGFKKMIPHEVAAHSVVGHLEPASAFHSATNVRVISDLMPASSLHLSGSLTL